MLKTKKTVLLGLMALFLPAMSFSNETTPMDGPHFYIQMENRSAQSMTIRFQKGIGNISLDPLLKDGTPLVSRSQRYGVVIKPMQSDANFHIFFKGKAECQFTVGFGSPGKPTFEIKGKGCVGAGYELIDNRKTLLLFVSEINL